MQYMLTLKIWIVDFFYFSCTICKVAPHVLYIWNHNTQGAIFFPIHASLLLLAFFFQRLTQDKKLDQSTVCIQATCVL